MFRWLTTALRALPFWQRPVKASPAKQRPASRERTPPPVPADHVYTVEERRQALAFLARLRPELQAYAVRKMSPKLLACVADQILSEPPGVDELPAAVRVLTRQFGAISTAGIRIEPTPKTAAVTKLEPPRATEDGTANLSRDDARLDVGGARLEAIAAINRAAKR